MRKIIMGVIDTMRRRFGYKCYDCRANSHCTDFGCIRKQKPFMRQWWMKY